MALPVTVQIGDTEIHLKVLCVLGSNIFFVFLISTYLNKIKKELFTHCSVSQLHLLALSIKCHTIPVVDYILNMVAHQL